MPKISPERIERASREIDPVFLNSPQFLAESLSRAVGCELLVKVETVNPVRSFKGRGTDFWFRSQIRPPDRVVCASAGNFGQGVAFAARRRNVPCIVFAAVNANPLKLDRMRALGAEVRLEGGDFDSAKAAARAFAAAECAYYLEDGAEAAIAEGAGSIAVELDRWPDPIDSVIVPLGNGALLGGMAAWLRQQRPDTRIIGVCAAGAPAMEISWRENRVATTPGVDTIADGIAVRLPVPFALETLRGTVDEMLLVDESSLVSAVRLLFQELGTLVEPAGAAGLAAILQHRAKFTGSRCATVLCGGNVTREQFQAWQIA